MNCFIVNILLFVYHFNIFQNYQVKIRDQKQPMLVSKPKKRDLRRGAGNIYLVPELCIMTGLTDDMRGDFNMMKDLAHYMRMAPDKRVQALIRFNKDLAKNEKAGFKNY